MYGVGLRIKKRRLELGMTQSDLAIKMGYTSKAAISKVEVNDDNITTERVEKFAKALNCSPAYLMGWENNDENEYYEPHYLNSNSELSKILHFDLDIKNIERAVELFKRYEKASEKTRNIVNQLLDEE